MSPQRTLSNRAQLHAAWAALGSIPAWWVGIRCLQDVPSLGVLVVGLFCIPGTALLLGYLRAATGQLGPKGQSRLWSASAVFNAMLAGLAAFTFSYADPTPAAAVFLGAWFGVLALSASSSARAAHLAATAEL